MVTNYREIYLMSNYRIFKDKKDSMFVAQM